MDRLRIGIIGFGTVGAGVVECIQRNADLVTERTGIRPVITRVADKDLESDRGVTLPPGVLVDEVDTILDASDIDVVVELVGGTTVAKDFVLRALRAGKPVVTANKALLAEHGNELFDAAERAGTDLYYEASVAGGIPVIKAIREGLAANRLVEIVGILNGTCNYILTRMEAERAPFDEVLAEAQRLGYAEADPGLDVDGIDTAHKAVILAALAYGEWFGMAPCYLEGIRGIALQDIEYAKALGYRIKLLAVVKQQEGNVQIRVHPALVRSHSMLGNVSDVFNAVWVRGDTVGGTLYYGRGAGRDATASAVVADLIDIGLNLKRNAVSRISAFRPHKAYDTITPMEDVEVRYYLRLQAVDRPGVLAAISGILGDANISIASVAQHEADQRSVPVVILTHKAREKDLRNALTKVAALPDITDAPVLIRIEDMA